MKTKKMKAIEKILTENQDAKAESEQFILWGKDGRNSELLFCGTEQECQEKLKEDYDKNHPDFSISKNVIRDQWENEVEMIGYVTFANDVTISYAMDEKEAG